MNEENVTNKLNHNCIFKFIKKNWEKVDQIYDQGLDGRRCRGLEVGDDVVKLITTQIRVISNLSGNVLGSGTLTKKPSFYELYIVHYQFEII